MILKHAKGRLFRGFFAVFRAFHPRAQNFHAQSVRKTRVFRVKFTLWSLFENYEGAAARDLAVAKAARSEYPRNRLRLTRATSATDKDPPSSGKGRLAALLLSQRPTRVFSFVAAPYDLFPKTAPLVVFNQTPIR